MAYTYNIPLTVYGWQLSKKNSTTLAGFSSAATETIGRSGSSSNYINRAISAICTDSDYTDIMQNLRTIYQASASDIDSITLNLTVASSLSSAANMYCGIKALDDTTPQIVETDTVSVPTGTSISIDVTEYGMPDLDTYMGWGIGGSSNSYRYATVTAASVVIVSEKDAEGGSSISGSIFVSGTAYSISSAKVFIGGSAKDVSAIKVYVDGEWK